MNNLPPNQQVKFESIQPFLKELTGFLVVGDGSIGRYDSVNELLNHLKDRYSLQYTGPQLNDFEGGLELVMDHSYCGCVYVYIYGEVNLDLKRQIYTAMDKSVERDRAYAQERAWELEDQEADMSKTASKS
jgi:hypothetical protein